MDNKYFLHELLKNTNIERPYPTLVDYDSFPIQDQTKINTTVEVTYYDQKFTPAEFNLDSHQPTENHERKFTEEFTIIRADDKDLYHDAKTVYLSKDCSKIIITQKDKNETFFVAIEGLTHLINLQVYPEYTDRSIHREAYLFSNQGLENGLATIIEYLDENTYRIILDTELFFEYNPDDIYVPTEEPDLGAIRRNLIEGRVPYIG